MSAWRRFGACGVIVGAGPPPTYRQRGIRRTAGLAAARRTAELGTRRDRIIGASLSAWSLAQRRLVVRSRVPRKILGVIPARYASSRFPGKALARSIRAPCSSMFTSASRWRATSAAVIIATDDQRIFDEARRFGARVRMTRADHLSGTDRVAEVASAFEDAELVVNIQGDEPLIDPSRHRRGHSAAAGRAGHPDGHAEKAHRRSARDQRSRTW